MERQPQLPLARDRQSYGQEELVEQTCEGTCVRSPPPRNGERRSSPLGPSQCPAVEGKSRIESQSAFRETFGEHLRELTRRTGAGAAEAAAGDA